MKIINKYLIEKISKYCDIDKTNKHILDSNDIVSLKKDVEKVNLIVNVGIVNNIRRINKLHESVNVNLMQNGIYVSVGETMEERRIRVRNKSPLGLKTIIRIIDFIYKRVLPKLPVIKSIYFSITRGYNRVISKAEFLGRIVSCGFEVVEYFEYENLFYIISKKVDVPKYDMNPSYGFLFKMKRIGYKGKIIRVYKIRTMHPFSEYCQDLIISENKLLESGKIANDFRITTWGKFLRRFWIDELPMFINFFKGELALVGVRPLSKGYFSKYPKEIQNLRIQVKPGLLPPYYADLPKNFDEILSSEKRYINKKIMNPIKTDFEYFFKILTNILKGSRSQ